MRVANEQHGVALERLKIRWHAITNRFSAHDHKIWIPAWRKA
jgi:hypothetical protein